eukprot:TRINITY_DN18016_c0_g2_i2.p1 TRINITY_DN18016_c0_g2~~TRINITY_DN18016_c0_g2_i2.p1  ORF type:complete len:190 (+),score=40.47 TRINITY_DN18016_c0_g2_i2:287-856(+)
MLTPRLPLYILCIYFGMIYAASVAASRANLPPPGEAALTGLLCCLFYEPYDICGPKFLWWTWHDSDPAISQRSFGAPNGSTCWILCYCSLHMLLLTKISEKLSDFTPAMQVALTALLCTPMFMAAMGVAQVVGMDTLGMPGLRTVLVLIAALVGVVASSMHTTHSSSSPSSPLRLSPSSSPASLSLIHI